MKVSVIIPYDRNRGWLEEAIESVERQTYRGEIEIIESQGKCFVGHNINEGFKDAEGDLVRFLCDDDMLTPTSIEDTVNYFSKNKSIDFAHSNAYGINSTGQILNESIPPKTPKTADELARRNTVHGGTVIYRRECFERCKWDPDLWTGEEYEYNMRLLSEGFNLGYFDKFTYMYRRHPNQKSARTPRNTARRKRAIDIIKRKYRNE